MDGHVICEIQIYDNILEQTKYVFSPPSLYVFHDTISIPQVQVLRTIIRTEYIP